MRYFAAIQSVLDGEKTESVRPAHLDFLEKKVAEGKLFAMGRFLDGLGGLVIYQSESLEEAKRIAEADPYVLNGVRQVQLHEWAMKVRS